MFERSAYLKRLGYSGSLSPSPETLRALHRAHMLAVPFENLDIALGRPIPCDAQTAIRKIVELGRGGFCYELNSAFATLLQELGFRVTMLSARVSREDGSVTEDFDHLALRVDLQESSLADVGFGDSFLEPLRLRDGAEQAEGDRRFRIVEEGGSFYVEKAEPDGLWKREYSFTLVPRKLDEFAAMCRYHQTSPDSPFTRRRICSRATDGGRITLADRRLIVTRNGVREESLLDSEEQWQAALKEHFGVDLGRV